MPLDVLRLSCLKKVSYVAACALACVWFQPSASGQRVVHPRPGGYAGAHFRPAAPISTPHITAPPRPIFFRPPHAFPRPPLLILRQPFFPRPPFLWSWQRFNSSWWLYCGPVWGWNSGCDNFFYSAPATEHHLAPPLTYQSPVYIYGWDGHPLAQLFLKDGTAFSVNDYWFVGNDVHFTALDQRGTKSVEQVIPFDDLDVPRTIDMNSRRGFRVVMRDEPLEQYLRDHPDVTPPLLQPQKN
jgi:hypothetical protein